MPGSVVVVQREGRRREPRRETHGESRGESRAQARRDDRTAEAAAGARERRPRNAPDARPPKRRRRRGRRPSLATSLRVLVAAIGRLRRGLRAAASPRYPEAPAALPAAFRGVPRLVALDDGAPRCVACGLCERACPARCIEIEAVELPDRAIERAPARFELDLGRCLFCGLCEEACPEEAIVMSDELDRSTADRATLRLGLPELLVPAGSVAARIGFLRREYGRDAREPRA